jgi:hypothetical protein
MNAEQSTTQKVQRARDIEALTKLWQAGMPTVPVPEMAQWELWFKLNNEILELSATVFRNAANSITGDVVS